GMGLGTLLDVIVVALAVEVEGDVIRMGKGVTQFTPQLQPGAVAKTVITQPVERVGTSDRVVEEAEIFQFPRWGAGEGSAVLHRVGGRSMGVTGRADSRGDQQGGQCQGCDQCAHGTNRGCCYWHASIRRPMQRPVSV